jgi:hypothetical protein
MTPIRRAGDMWSWAAAVPALDMAVSTGLVGGAGWHESQGPAMVVTVAALTGIGLSYIPSWRSRPRKRDVW